MKNVLIIICVGVLATVLAVFLASLLFPRTWLAVQKTRIDAPMAVVYPLIAESDRQPEWNPWFLDASSVTVEGDAIIAEIEGERASGTLTMSITDRVEGERVQARIQDGTNDVGNHEWRLEPVGSGVEVRWEGRGTRERRLLGRFASLAVSQWMDKQLEDGLELLRERAERQAIQSDVIVDVPE